MEKLKVVNPYTNEVLDTINYQSYKEIKIK